MSFSSRTHFGSLDFLSRRDSRYDAEERSRLRGDSPCRLCGHYTGQKTQGYCTACYQALCELLQQRRSEAERHPERVCARDAAVQDWEQKCSR